MICDNCKKNPSTVHLKGITNGMKMELRLCQECSTSMSGLINPQMPINLENILSSLNSSDSPISLENIFKGLMESVQSTGAIPQPNSPKFPQKARKAPGPCAVCGLNYEQFKTTGKLGCESCYQAFPKEIVALFKNVQNSSRHEGKYPKRSGAGIRQRREVDKLRNNLQQAVEDENYEEAARIRDQIRSMEVT